MRILLLLACLAWTGRQVSAQSTFQRQLDSLNGLFCLEQTTDGVYWLGTFLGKIIRLDEDGQYLNGFALRRGDTASARFVYDLERAPGSGVFALFDRTNNNNMLDDQLILARLDQVGQPLWQTTVHYGEVLHWAHNRLAADPSGNVYALSIQTVFQSPGIISPNRMILTRVGPGGEVVWTRRYTNDAVNAPRALRRLSDGTLLICGNAQTNASSGFILRLSADGEVLFSRRSAGLLYKNCAELPDGSLVFAATESGPLPQRACILRTDAAGNLLWARRLNMPYALNWIPELMVTPQGDILVGNYETPDDFPVADLICLSQAGDFRWARRYDQCHNHGISAMVATRDSGIAAIRFRPGGHLLLKTDLQGQCANCPADALTIGLEPVADQSGPLSWQSDFVPAPAPASTDFLPFSTQVRDFCGQAAVVTGILPSADTVCAYAPLAFSATGPVVADSYQWTFPGGTPAQGSGMNVFPVRWSVPGTVAVSMVSRFGFCRDTFQANLKVVEAPAPFNLGPDTTLCGAWSELLVDAGPAGAATYLWMDGYDAPERIITAGGTYIVSAHIGVCSVSDTLRVVKLEGLAVDLPSDTALCGQDTIWLDAFTPYGERYRWSDGDTNAMRSVTRSGIYAVTVFRGDCQASDLVSVELFPAPPLLPRDTLLCTGQTLELDVGKSLAGRVWWNDQPGYARFEVQDTGMVVRRIEYRNCLFEDTIHVRRGNCIDGFAAWAPNVFAPDRGGDNARFTVFGPGLELLRLSVYDRWGRLAWTGTGNAAVWNGAAAPPGVYVWQARVRQQGREGWIAGEVIVVK